MHPQWGVHATGTQACCVGFLRGHVHRAARNGGQGSSHRRRPLEVAISIADGTGKCQWAGHALAGRLGCSSCPWVACGLCRPLGLACRRLELMACAHRKAQAEFSQFPLALRINKSKKPVIADNFPAYR